MSQTPSVSPRSPRSPRKQRLVATEKKSKDDLAIPCQELSPEQQLEMQEVFNLFDIDQNQLIDGYELQIALRALGFPFSDEDIQTVMKRYNKKKGHSFNAINLEEFYQVVGEQLAGADPEKEIKKAFNYFCRIAKNKDTLEEEEETEETRGTKRKKYITLDILKAALVQLKRGNEKTDEQLMEEISRWDTDGDGKLSYEEFREIMFYQPYEV